jgi:TonB family protein
LAASSPSLLPEDSGQTYVVPERLEAREEPFDFSGAYASVWGGEVSLDFAVDPSGHPRDLRMRSGGGLFASLARKAVEERWVLHFPEANAVGGKKRVAVVFQFRGALLTPPERPARNYDASTYSFLEDRPPVPKRVVEPRYPVQSIAEGLVVLGAEINRQGQIAQLAVLKPVASLTEAAMEAVREWEFLPGMSRNQPTDSALLIAIYFRRPILAPARHR